MFGFVETCRPPLRSCISTAINFIEKLFSHIEKWLVGDIFLVRIKGYFSMKNQKHTLNYIKRQAKNLKRERGISHTEALESLSKDLGYSNWQHCRRLLDRQAEVQIDNGNKQFQLSFTDWLKKHVNRNAPLGDLARDASQDSSWPSYDNLNDYRDYLHSQNACSDAVITLDKAWKSYKSYLQRKKSSTSNKKETKMSAPAKQSQRKVVIVKNITPIHYSIRTVEKFIPGDEAWISWDGKKAVPVKVTEVDGPYYSFEVEAPQNKAGNEHYLRLDEVRSTPELACINCVTS